MVGFVEVLDVVGLVVVDEVVGFEVVVGEVDVGITAPPQALTDENMSRQTGQQGIFDVLALQSLLTLPAGVLEADHFACMSPVCQMPPMFTI